MGHYASEMGPPDDFIEASERDRANSRKMREANRFLPDPVDPSTGTKEHLTFERLREAITKRSQEISPTGFRRGDRPLIDSIMDLDWAVSDATRYAKQIDRFFSNPDPEYSRLKWLRSMLSFELAEAVIRADMIAAALGIDLAESVKEKFNQVSERTGSGLRI